MLAPSSLKNVFKIYIYLIPLGLKNTYTLSKSIYSSVVHNNTSQSGHVELTTMRYRMSVSHSFCPTKICGK